MRYLLDTNIITEPLKRVPHITVMQRLHHYQHELAIAAPVWHELWFGCSRLEPSKRRTQIEEYLNNVVLPTMQILPYDEKAAYWYAHERARLSKIGYLAPFADGQIAAVAIVHKLILVTNNVADYKNYIGLQLENWFE